MNDILQIFLTLPLRVLLTIAGIGFLLISVGASIKEKIEPDKWGRIGSAVIGIVFIAIGLSSAQMGPLEQGFDRPGGDYRDFDLYSVETCRSICASEGRCLAFTFRSSGSPPHCWLKEIVPGKVANASYTSGVKSDSSHNFMGCTLNK